MIPEFFNTSVPELDAIESIMNTAIGATYRNSTTPRGRDVAHYHACDACQGIFNSCEPYEFRFCPLCAVPLLGPRKVRSHSTPRWQYDLIKRGYTCRMVGRSSSPKVYTACEVTIESTLSDGTISKEIVTLHEYEPPCHQYRDLKAIRSEILNIKVQWLSRSYVERVKLKFRIFQEESKIHSERKQIWVKESSNG